MASNHYPVDYEIEVKVKIKVKQLHNYHPMSEDDKAEAINVLKEDLPEAVAYALNNKHNFIEYSDLLGCKGAADRYSLEAII